MWSKPHILRSRDRYRSVPWISSFLGIPFYRNKWFFSGSVPWNSAKFLIFWFRKDGFMRKVVVVSMKLVFQIQEKIFVDFFFVNLWWDTRFVKWFMLFFISRMWKKIGFTIFQWVLLNSILSGFNFIHYLYYPGIVGQKSASSSFSSSNLRRMIKLCKMAERWFFSRFRQWNRFFHNEITLSIKLRIVTHAKNTITQKSRNSQLTLTKHIIKSCFVGKIRDTRRTDEFRDKKIN